MLTLEVYKHIKTLLKDRPLASFEGSDLAQSGTRTFTDGTRSIHVVTGEAECRAALTQPEFRQHDFAELLRTALPENDSDSCIAKEFFEPNPINLNGEAHKAARHEFLLTFNSLRKTTLPEVRSLAERSLNDMVERGNEASITDTVTTFIDDVVGCFLSRLGTGISDPALWSGSSTCIFEFFPSAARLRKKEKQANYLLETLDVASDSAGLDKALVFSLVFQGRDPLIGGLCAFLTDLSRTSAAERDKRLVDTDGIRLFRATTPVNYIGRIATRDTNIAGLNVTKGDEVVVMLSLAVRSGERVGLAFGAGSHVCAGQTLAMDIVDCWLEELRRAKNRINWSELRPVVSAPGVFQQFEDVKQHGPSGSHRETSDDALRGPLCGDRHGEAYFDPRSRFA